MREAEEVNAQEGGHSARNAAAVPCVAAYMVNDGGTSAPIPPFSSLRGLLLRPKRNDAVSEERDPLSPVHLPRHEPKPIEDNG